MKDRFMLEYSSVAPSAGYSVRSVETMNEELAAADATLVGNEQLLAALFSGSGDCIKILDLDGRLQFMSEGGKRVMEVDDFSVVKGCPWPDFWQDDGNLAARQAIETAKSGKAAQFFGAANTAKGNPRYWDVLVIPVWGKNGTPSQLLSISRDITETKIARDTAAKLYADARDASIREAEAMRRLLLNAPSFMCVFEGPDHVYTMTNNSYLQIVGHRDLVGLPVGVAAPPFADPAFHRVLDEVYATGKPFHGRGQKMALQRIEGGVFEDAYFNFVYQPVFDAHGRVKGIFCEGSDVTDQKMAELALRNKEMQLSLALDAAGMGVWKSTFDGDAFLSTENDERAKRILGAPVDADGDDDAFVSRVHPDDCGALTDAARRALDPDSGGILDIEYRIAAADNQPERWVHACARAMPGDGGTRFVGTVRDISDRKEAEARQRLLSAELQHRIKNTLAMVSAIATQTLKGEAVTEQRTVFNARLQTLSQAQDLLLGNAEERGLVRDVIMTALAPHSDSASCFEIDGPDLMLTARQTLSLALVIHELATNAMKYGALSVPGGRVAISWSNASPDPSRSLFEFRWEERDGPPVQAPVRSGFGSRLISRVFASDFSGTVSIDYPETGVVCALTPRQSGSVGRMTGRSV